MSETEQPEASRGTRRLILLSIGWICVALGAVGVFLPLLPTTPFLLIAVWAFSRSSKRLAAWLYGHPRFGPLLANWDAYRIIPLWAKCLATAMMGASLTYMWFVAEMPWPVRIIAASVCLFAVIYIWRKPHRRPAQIHAAHRDAPALQND